MRRSCGDDARACGLALGRIPWLHLALLVGGCYVDHGRAEDPTRRDGGPADGGCSGECGGMVWVPRGTVQMGCTDTYEGCDGSSARPRHAVEVSAFHIDVTEVTAAAYALCAEAGACEAVPCPASGTEPYSCAAWADAAHYCEWSGRRLCTEAEWERAARGSDERHYPWGDEEPTCARAIMLDGVHGCGAGGPWPVGSRPRGSSSFGALDMSGNVWEWVGDYWARDYYAESPTLDPHGPASGTSRVLRGGGWRSAGADLAAWWRAGTPPTARGEGDRGVRCCR